MFTCIVSWLLWASVQSTAWKDSSLKWHCYVSSFNISLDIYSLSTSLSCCRLNYIPQHSFQKYLPVNFWVHHCVRLHRCTEHTCSRPPGTAETFLRDSGTKYKWTDYCVADSVQLFPSAFQLYRIYNQQVQLRQVRATKLSYFSNTCIFYWLRRKYYWQTVQMSVRYTLASTRLHWQSRHCW